MFSIANINIRFGQDAQKWCRRLRRDLGLGTKDTPFESRASGAEVGDIGDLKADVELETVDVAGLETMGYAQSPLGDKISAPFTNSPWMTLCWEGGEP